MTDTPTDAGTDDHLPDEPPPDAFEWTEEPGDPDHGGPAAEFVNDAPDGVPGVRRETGEPAPEGRNSN